MKNGRQAVKPGKRHRQRQHEHPPAATRNGNSFLPRWLVLVLCVVLAAGATWAGLEFIVWNQLPENLVGKWVVVGGPQDGATFDFYRGGALEARLNRNGNVFILKAQVAVADKKLLVTTQNPQTKKDETCACDIRELNATTLIVEFEKGDVYKIMRAR